MRIIAVATIILATLPVLALSAAPKTDEQVLAVFEPGSEKDTILRASGRLGLDVLSYDETLGHLIVQDHSGNAIRALQGMGAWYVLDADLFLACRPTTPISKSI